MRLLRLPPAIGLAKMALFFRKQEFAMTDSALTQFTAYVRDIWGQPTSEVIANCRAGLEQLLHAPPADQWLADLRNDLPESRELYRDPMHGFVLLGHTEAEGRYRNPHDHGSSWVIYGVLQGEMEMGSYTRVYDENSNVHLAKQGLKLVRPGDVQVYLPGDIHDTRCVNGPAIQFRFTARDLRLETNMTRYIDLDGAWGPADREE